MEKAALSKRQWPIFCIKLLRRSADGNKQAQKALVMVNVTSDDIAQHVRARLEVRPACMMPAVQCNTSASA